MKLELIDNCFDFLRSASELAKSTEQRSLKYAILHLYAGAELLLKERLRREHWSLIFSDVDKATEESLESGDFKSADFQSICKRLKDIADVTFDGQQQRELDSLRKLRNRLQHFHAELEGSDARSQCAKVMSLCVEFISAEMSDVNSSHAEELRDLHDNLMYFTEYVRHRTLEIQDRLKQAVSVVGCSRCDQTALMLGKGDPVCAFCGYTDSPIDAVIYQTGGGVIGHCPVCDGPMGEYGEE